MKDNVEEFRRVLKDFEQEASKYNGTSLSVYFVTNEEPPKNRRFEQPNNYVIMLWQYYGAIGDDESIERFVQQQPTQFGLTGAVFSTFAVVEGEGTDLFIKMATRAGNLIPHDDPGPIVPKDIKIKIEKVDSGQKPVWVRNTAPAATWLCYLLNYISENNPSRLWGGRLQLDPFAVSLSAMEQLATKYPAEKQKVKIQEETKVDSFIKKTKDHPFFSILIILVIIVIGLANFTDAVNRLFAFFSFLQNRHSLKHNSGSSLNNNSSIAQSDSNTINQTHKQETYPELKVPPKEK